VQGLDGAPRRFSVLPNGWWEDLAEAALPIVAVLAAAQLLFVWNVVQTARGAGERSRVERRRRMATAVAEAVMMLIVLALVALAFAFGFFLGRETADDGGAGTTTTPAETGGGGDAQGLPGAEVFASAGCGSCHTLSAAGATGAVGPSLDATTLGEAQIVEVVSAGRGGMPSFSGQLSEEEIAQVAAYVGAARTPSG
jgi:mono/diheme cytochrome c family protein